MIDYTRYFEVIDDIDSIFSTSTTSLESLLKKECGDDKQFVWFNGKIVGIKDSSAITHRPAKS